MMYTIEGTVRFTTGNTPSLAAVGLSLGDPIYYSFLVDTNRDGFVRNGDGSIFIHEDVSNEQGTYDYFYAELTDISYTSPIDATIPDAQRFFAVNIDSNSPAGPVSYSEVWVGPYFLRFSTDSHYPDWSLATAFVSEMNWTDEETNIYSTIVGDLTITSIKPVPVPQAAILFVSAVLFLVSRIVVRYD